MDEPVTLHKYLYGNGESVNGRDPSGNNFLVESLVVVSIAAIIIGTTDYSYHLSLGSDDFGYGVATINNYDELAGDKLSNILLSKKESDDIAKYEYGIKERDCRRGGDCNGYIIQTSYSAPWSVPQGWVKCKYECKGYGAPFLRYMPEEIGCPSPTAWAPGWYLPPPPRNRGELLPKNPFNMNN